MYIIHSSQISNIPAEINLSGIEKSNVLEISIDRFGLNENSKWNSKKEKKKCNFE